MYMLYNDCNQCPIQPAWLPSMWMTIKTISIYLSIRHFVPDVHIRGRAEKFMKELCHSNETWHGLNWTFPDTNCIVSFQINPRWISNAGLWQVSTRDISWTAWETDKRSSVSAGQCSCTQLCDCGFELVDHPVIWHYLSFSCSQTWTKNQCPGETWLPLSVFQVVHEMSLVLPFKVLNLLIQCGFMWKDTLQLVSGEVEFNACQASLLWHNSFLISLWTFQPTLVTRLSVQRQNYTGWSGVSIKWLPTW